MKKIIWGAYLFFAVNIIFGCAGLVPIVPVMGTIYDGHVGWKEHQSVKYYAADINTIHRAIMLSSKQLNLKVVRKNLL